MCCSFFVVQHGSLLAVSTFATRQPGGDKDGGGDMFGAALPFGSAAPAAAAPAFGAAPAGGGLFGGTPSSTTAPGLTRQPGLAATPGVGLFGAPAPAAAPALGGGLFGAAPAAAPALGGGLFGATPSLMTGSTALSLPGMTPAVAPAPVAPMASVDAMDAAVFEEWQKQMVKGWDAADYKLCSFKYVFFDDLSQAGANGLMTPPPLDLLHKARAESLTASDTGMWERADASNPDPARYAHPASEPPTATLLPVSPLPVLHSPMTAGSHSESGACGVRLLACFGRFCNDVHACRPTRIRGLSWVRAACASVL